MLCRGSHLRHSTRMVACIEHSGSQPMVQLRVKYYVCVQHMPTGLGRRAMHTLHINQLNNTGNPCRAEQPAAAKTLTGRIHGRGRWGPQGQAQGQSPPQEGPRSPC